MSYSGIREEELKNKIAKDYFGAFDCTNIIGNIDFSVALRNNESSLFDKESLLWAEAKAGKKADIYESFVQLILTIGKARTFDKNLPPAYLGAFDAEKIAFIPYNTVQDIFYQNDFNWNVTPSNHETKEFLQVYDKVKSVIENNSLLYEFDIDDKELKSFIKKNFVIGKSSTSKIKIDKNNFMAIYTKWLNSVKPTIAVNWDVAKKNGIIDGDFYLADLLSRENETLKEKLYVLLKGNHYEIDRKMNEMGMFDFKTTTFTDNQKAHTQFWNKYERPPKEDYWDYIVNRRDLLVPQDVRERKGSYFTPQIWVELSQKYIADVLGEDWQEEYYVWDCAAGTGNLLAGLTNKYNIWASTLGIADVDVMKDRIRNGANLLESHVFQFDFLNDEFSKLPQGLQDIINNPEKRKKLVIYINPPYAEAGNSKQRSGTGENKSNTTTENKTYEKYRTKIGKASNELFVQFLIRAYCEIPCATIANFSKLKNLQSFNFSDFRNIFKPKLEKIFIVPAKTFDNVTGKFPIGFFIWNLQTQEVFKRINADVYSNSGLFLGEKMIYCFDDTKFLSLFTKTAKNNKDIYIGHFAARGNDFQNQNAVFIDNLTENIKGGGIHVSISHENLIKVSISFTVRKIIEATWLNDRDQFLYPNDDWENDTEFQNDCLTYTLFNNNIQSKFGVNHWIPFTEYVVQARDKFESHFMTDFIAGKLESDVVSEPTFSFYKEDEKKKRTTPLDFSPEAKAVFNAGRELWHYYHVQPNCNVNASLYDIREYFQGRNEQGKMNNASDDEKYMSLITELRKQIRILAKKNEPKVYEYGFLKE